LAQIWVTGMDEVHFNDACVKLAREGGMDWRKMSFDEKTKIRLELEPKLMPKIGPAKPPLRWDQSPIRPVSEQPGLVSIFMGGPIVPADSPMALRGEAGIRAANEQAARQMVEQAHRKAGGGREYATRPGVGAGPF
jgi:hypothetical protein